jgi:acyl dehydratase
MPVSYEQLMQLTFPEVTQCYTARDTMLYALSLGVGGDPAAPHQLNLVYEKNLQALPTMSVVLAHPGFWPRDRNTGLDYTRIVHGAQQLVMHRTLAVAGTVTGRSRIRDIIDKGAGRGALVYFARELRDSDSGELICTMEQTLFCRGDGGMGGSGNAPPALTAIPDRAPDAVSRHVLLPQSALLYRLNGDMNPLHADPEIAREAGFDRPILQGLATYGIAGLALVDTVCGGDPARLRELSARFTAPVYPGETLLTEIWQQEHGVSLRTSVPARNIVALDNGSARLAAR